jgi:radical SAM superfamily enzyme YgiQ (UPF0313 family)
MNAEKPPASLAFLAGACESAGVEYNCVSLNYQFLKNLSNNEYNNIYAQIKLNSVENFFTVLDQPIEDIICNIVNYQPDIVVVSVFSFMQYSLTEFFLQKLRQRLPQTEVIAGGPGIQYTNNNTSNGQKLLNQGLVDYYCLGEGDQVLPMFLKGQRNLLGINSKNHAYESWVPQINDLDQHYIVPSYKKIPTDGFHNLENKTLPVYSVSTSRGCVRDCAFCDVGNLWKKFKFRSGQSVAQEILQHHQDVGAVHFTIVDSLINGSLKSFREFNLEMIKLKEKYQSLKNFSYNGMFIVRDARSHNEEFFKTIAAAGCESLWIGVETGSDRLRFEMNKKFTNNDLDHHLEMCQKYGIKNTFLMFVGYPTETQSDFELSLRMLDRYQHYLIDRTIIGINHSGVFSIIPDTPVYNHREEIGIEMAEHQESSVLQWTNVNNPDLTVKERILRDLRFREHALNLRYPIPYATRYLEYLKHIDRDFLPIAD